jgi:type VI secretion system FHA domain protein
MRGGTIGRADDNDWILPDPEQIVSRLHAEIESRGDEFWIIDRSQNGTFVNEFQIRTGQRQRLEHGSRLRIGKYEIAVAVEAAEIPAAMPSRERHPPNGADQQPVGVDDILKSFPDRGDRVSAPDPWPAERDHVSPLKEHYRPPRVKLEPRDEEGVRRDVNRAAPHIPEDIVERARRRKQGSHAPPRIEQSIEQGGPVDWPGSPEAQPTPDRPPRAREAPSMREESAQPDAVAPRAADTGLVQLLVAAGLHEGTAHDAVRDPSIVAGLGEGLSTLIRCIMETLDARSNIRREFGLPVTAYRAESNNPLKCSITPEEALERLVMGGDSAYMGPREAFDEASEDVRAHQIAMMAGMRAAFRSMLSHFDPDQLESRCEGTSKQSALLRVTGKGRYWEMYKEYYAEVTGDATVNFQRLFGQQFARAYQEQLQQLQHRRRR